MTSTRAQEPNAVYDNRSRILQVVSLIPAGRVATYGQIATLAGMPGAARQVGHALRSLPEGSTLPWHRVVNAAGKLSLPQQSTAGQTQQTRLEQEGVVLLNAALDLPRYRWCP